MRKLLIILFIFLSATLQAQIIRASANYVSSVPDPYGAEIVLIGDFANNSQWSAEVGAAVSGGKCNFAVTNGSRVTQSYGGNVYTSGKTYKIEFDISDASEAVNFAFYGDGFGSLFADASYTNGHYSFETTALMTSSYLIIIRSPLGVTFSMDNLSIKEVK
jgi:hypothetical protein